MNDKMMKLKKLLRKAEKNGGESVREEASDFLKTVSPAELAQAEDGLLAEGLAPESLRHLCAAHIALMQESLPKEMENLPKKHPVSILVSEHEEILKFLDQLEGLSRRVKKMTRADQFSDVDLALLQHLVYHLAAAEKHHQREEEVLFPEMEKRGIVGPPEILRTEHISFRDAKSALDQLSRGEIKNNFNKFQDKLEELVSFLVFNLRDHIFKENAILYPAALSAIEDEETWQSIGKECDAIGYCCFTPEHLF